MKNTLWVEKYRPKTVDAIILKDASQDQFFKGIVKSKILPNLLLYGVQGTGKTTISKALISDLNVDLGDVLTINCSDEKIDALRDKVRGFASTLGFGKFRVVRLEECDHLSLDGQALLRSLIEQTSANCRFIATCNYVNKIIPPLRSRFQEVEFKSPNKDDVIFKMADMLELEGASFDPEQLIFYTDSAYPDIRKIIQLLQQNTVDGILKPSESNLIESDWKLELLETLSSGDFSKGRKIVCAAPKEEHEDVFRFLYTNVEKIFNKQSVAEEAIVIIAEHLMNHTLVADTEINLAACMIKLGLLGK